MKDTTMTGAQDITMSGSAMMEYLEETLMNQGQR